MTVYLTPYAPDPTGRPMPTAPSEAVHVGDLASAVATIFGFDFIRWTGRIVIYRDFVLTDWVLAL